MTYEVVFAQQAERDLRNVYEYVASELGEPRAAARIINHIRASVEGLATFPRRRPLVDFEPWRSRHTRWLLVGNYLVFYVTDDKKSIVSVYG